MAMPMPSEPVSTVTSKTIASANTCSATPPDHAPAPTLTIDVGAVVANWRLLCARHTGETAAVVKADAYGLGAALIAPALAAAGCRRFFVATTDEAFALRRTLPAAWIAVLNGCPPGLEADALAHNISPVLNSLADCARWQAAARKSGRRPSALLHIDTGMSRLGLDAAECATLLAEPGRLDGINLNYIMTHLVAAEDPNALSNQRQAAHFAAIAARFPGIGTSITNSSGIFLGPNFATDLARPGIALYGGNPTPHAPNPMRPVITLSAPILQIRAINAGDTVGYNASWRAGRPSLIATIGVGYADGLPRSLAGRLTARHHDRVIPLVGRVSMDLMTFDITDNPDLTQGTPLELIGPGHDIDAIAAEAGTIPYEILTSLGRRYRRVVKSV
ncbi:alanine racemase [Acidiphilium sp.]|uniref:alanine racemase n=1 Tax=Acidiphilium sp. TaxID=527 RepID=UPI003D028AED